MHALPDSDRRWVGAVKKAVRNGMAAMFAVTILFAGSAGGVASAQPSDDPYYPLPTPEVPEQEYAPAPQPEYVPPAPEPQPAPAPPPPPVEAPPEPESVPEPDYVPPPQAPAPQAPQEEPPAELPSDSGSNPPAPVLPVPPAPQAPTDNEVTPQGVLPVNPGETEGTVVPPGSTDGQQVPPAESPPNGDQPVNGQSVPEEQVPAPDGTQPEGKIAEVTVPVDVPKPEGPKPVPEEVRNQAPIVVTATSADEDESDDHDGQNGHQDDESPEPPNPGDDKVINVWKNNQVQQFPTSTDINVEGDDNTVTVINNVTNVTNVTNNTTNNINIVDIDVTKIENRRDWLYLRNFDHPDRVIRVPVEYGRPVRLNPGWCGGQGGAWSFSAAVAGSNMAAAFAGSGVFYANSGCGYSHPPRHPRHYPPALYVYPPRGYYGPPVHQGRYYIPSRGCGCVYAPEYNTYYYGGWEQRPVYIPQERRTRPQQVFVPYRGSAPDTVFQKAPIPGPPPALTPKWRQGGFESSLPDTSLLAKADEHRVAIGLGALGLVALIGAGAWGLSRRQA